MEKILVEVLCKYNGGHEGVMLDLIVSCLFILMDVMRSLSDLMLQLFIFVKYP